MSSFFCTEGLSALPININAEHAYTSRKFLKKPIIQISTNYRAALFLTYSQTKSLPNRKNLYRNHFTMFLNRQQFEILICRTETTQVYVDNDAIILYQRIGLSKDETMRFTNHDISEWAVSFDKDITYSSSEPTDFDNFELLCSGEWWYFDRGVVLNGWTRYVQYESDDKTNTEGIDAVVETCDVQPLPLMANLCKCIFIYYELYPELEIVKRKSAQSSTTAPLFRSPMNSNDTLVAMPSTAQKPPVSQPTVVQVVSHDHLGFLQNLLQTNTTEMPQLQSDLRFSSVHPQMTSIANNLAEKTMSLNNDNIQTPVMTYQNVVPARFWFLERSREFRSKCIDYFTTIGTWRTKI